MVIIWGDLNRAKLTGRLYQGRRRQRSSFPHYLPPGSYRAEAIARKLGPQAYLRFSTIGTDLCPLPAPAVSGLRVSRLFNSRLASLSSMTSSDVSGSKSELRSNNINNTVQTVHITETLPDAASLRVSQGKSRTQFWVKKEKKSAVSTTGRFPSSLFSELESSVLLKHPRSGSKTDDIKNIDIPYTSQSKSKVPCVRLLLSYAN